MTLTAGPFPWILGGGILMSAIALVGSITLLIPADRLRRIIVPLVAFAAGSVIIDVIDPVSQDLLWRGRGVALVSDDAEQYLAHLRNTVAAILDEFPRAPAPIAKIP